MKFTKIHFIINPAAGAEEPILSYLNNAFKNTTIDWEVFITKQGEDASNFARHCLNHADLIAVYGGDGSISEVAKVLVGKNIPLAIIPGGTANIISKELGIPQDPVEAIELLKTFNPHFIQMNMGALNGLPFLIRVNFGIMADMILEADRSIKDKLGQLAYGITAVKALIKSTPNKFSMTLDGVIVEETGIAMTVTNCGNIGIGNYSFLPDISVTDGMFDVILLKDSTISDLLGIAGTTLFQHDSKILKHWRCNQIKIELDHSLKIILDDEEIEGKVFDISMLKENLTVLVP